MPSKTAGMPSSLCWNLQALSVAFLDSDKTSTPGKARDHFLLPLFCFRGDALKLQAQFAGAAQELKSALIVNPYDIEATAAAIARAFAMPLDERKDRWNAMMAALRANSVYDWASHFLQAL